MDAVNFVNPQTFNSIDPLTLLRWCPIPSQCQHWMQKDKRGWETTSKVLEGFLSALRGSGSQRERWWGTPGSPRVWMFSGGSRAWRPGGPVRTEMSFKLWRRWVSLTSSNASCPANRSLVSWGCVIKYDKSPFSVGRPEFQIRSVIASLQLKLLTEAGNPLSFFTSCDQMQIQPWPQCSGLRSNVYAHQNINKPCSEKISLLNPTYTCKAIQEKQQ